MLILNWFELSFTYGDSQQLLGRYYTARVAITIQYI